MFERLKKIGITIEPYYLSESNLIDSKNINLNPSLNPIFPKFLSPHEIEEIYTQPESRFFGPEKK